MGILVIVILTLLVFRLVFFCGPHAFREELPKDGIIDMHCHTAGIGEKSDCYISDDLRNSWKFKIYLKIFSTNQTTLEQYGDRYIIEKIAERVKESVYVSHAVILAMDCALDSNGQLDKNQTEAYIPNRFVGETIKEFDQLLFGASVNPYRPDALEELTWSKENGAILLKWLPSIQNIDPSDERIIPFYKKLVELDLPLLTHVGSEESFTKAKNELADPVKLELPLSLGVKVIAAHVASSGESEGQENIDRLMPLFDKYPTLYGDISTLTQFNRKKYLGRVLSDPRLKGKLHYGTDHPLTNTPMVSPWLFLNQLTLKEIWSTWRIKNPWDRDVKLKQLLGMPKEVFELPKKLLIK